MRPWLSPCATRRKPALHAFNQVSPGLEIKVTVVPAPHVRRAGLIITIASLAVIAFATLLPAPGPTVASHFCLVCGSLGGLNAVLNVLLFVPLGVGLALSGLPGKRAIFAACLLSALIEVAQFSLIGGRDSTIGDVLTNTLGGALGFAIGRYAGDWLRPSPGIARNLAVVWATIWFVIQVISSYGFAPTLPDSQYYGEIARVFWNFEVFRGRVLSASINDVQIPNTAFADSRTVRRLLLDGATVAATVVPAEPTREVAPIVRIADEMKREIVLLAQNRDDVVFGIHTGAGVLRLRPPLFGLPGVFPSGRSTHPLAADTLRLSGRYASSTVRMTADSRSATHDRRIPLNASLGWTFWLPFPWFIEGTRMELILSWLWLACLAVPLGYWAVRHNDPLPSEGIVRRWSPVLLAGLALLSAGLVVVPMAFGLSAASLRDWLATLAGILIGGGFGALGAKLAGKPTPMSVRGEGKRA